MHDYTIQSLFTLRQAFIFIVSLENESARFMQDSGNHNDNVESLLHFLDSRFYEASYSNRVDSYGVPMCHYKYLQIDPLYRQVSKLSGQIIS